MQTIETEDILPQMIFTDPRRNNEENFFDIFFNPTSHELKRLEFFLSHRFLIFSLIFQSNNCPSYKTSLHSLMLLTLLQTMETIS